MMTDKQPAAIEEYGEPIVHLVRGHKVVLGVHLAEAYEIDQQILVQAIERNIENFPEDSVFRLSGEEIAGLKLAASGPAAAYAFTRYGVAALSSFLLDEQALHESSEDCAPTCSCRK